MFHFTLFFVLLLVIVQNCCTLPYKEQHIHQSSDWYLEKEHDSGCGHEEQHHRSPDYHNTGLRANLNQQQYQLYLRPHFSLYTRLLQLPQDTDYINPNWNTDRQPNHNEYYGDGTTDESALTIEDVHNSRTILDAPKNCKQKNFKGKCIKY